MSDFSTAWLDLREPLDHAARDAALLQRAAACLPATGGAILDLGSGTGSSYRAFAPIEAARQRWQLVDNDPLLLAEASRRCGASVQTRCADLRQLDALPLDGVHLVTASALLDLCPEDWIDGLATRIAASGAGFYAALSYDGEMHFSPGHQLDATVVSAFNSHQRSDKGLGPALGPDAASVTARIFRNHGFTVASAPSPWHIGTERKAMLTDLVAGIVGAVLETGSLSAESVAGWGDFHRAPSGSGTLTVGHVDLLAFPA
jgi:SAM-dependent methyltransferase